jgi:hypothetical protein
MSAGYCKGKLFNKKGLYFCSFIPCRLTSRCCCLQALLEREELLRYEIEAIIAANPPDQPWEELTAGEPYELWDRDWKNSPYLIKFGAVDLSSELVPDYVRPLPKLPSSEQKLLDETREETSAMTQ